MMRRVMGNGPAWFETTRYAGLLTMRSDRSASRIFFAPLAESASPHGEEAQSAVSNHEGPDAAVVCNNGKSTAHV
jgi:hypothetical protein